MPLTATCCGVQWLAPALYQLVWKPSADAMTKTDILFQMLGGCAATVLLLLLLSMLFQGEAQPAARPGGAAAPSPRYKLNVVGLAIRMLVLPLIFTVLYYLIWYYLLWRVEAARVFYGRPEKLGFMAELIGILVDSSQNRQVLVIMLKGLAYPLLTLPLLLQMQGKRVMFLASTVMLYCSGALLYLIPSPVMPDPVRMAHLLETGVLILVYGVLSALLLHTVVRKETPPIPAAAKAAPAAQPGAGKAAAKPAAVPGTAPKKKQ